MATELQSEKVQRPLSAWIIYCNENRATIKDLNPEFGFKEIAKALSEGFKSLSDEDRAIYDLKATHDKERYVREMKEYQLLHPPSTSNVQRLQSSQSLPREIIFPLARVKKIMKLDGDVRNIQKEALVVVSKATELFLAYLGTRSFQAANRHKRKTIKDSDLVEVIHGLDTLSFLHSDFPKFATKSRVVRNEPQDVLQESTDIQNTPLSKPISKYFSTQQAADL